MLKVNHRISNQSNSKTLMLFYNPLNGLLSKELTSQNFERFHTRLTLVHNKHQFLKASVLDFITGFFGGKKA